MTNSHTKEGKGVVKDLFHTTVVKEGDRVSWYGSFPDVFVQADFAAMTENQEISHLGEGNLAIVIHIHSMESVHENSACSWISVDLMQKNLFGIGVAEFISTFEVGVIEGSHVVPELLPEGLYHLVLMVLWFYWLYIIVVSPLMIPGLDLRSTPFELPLKNGQYPWYSLSPARFLQSWRKVSLDDMIGKMSNQHYYGLRSGIVLLGIECSLSVDMKAKTENL